MRVQLRIVAGSLRGRRIVGNVNPKLGARPTPDRVREALFNILGAAVPDRPFIDVFAGSGVVGLEAFSRGASSVLFVERDLRQAQDIERLVRDFGLGDRGWVARGDAYRWAKTWEVPDEPATVFVSPPFADIQRRPHHLLALLDNLRAELPAGSVIVFQSERHSELDGHPALADWEERRYGRNVLLFRGAMTEREFAISVVRRLQEAGHEALWAGGCVRDELLGRQPKDYDVATSAHPDEVHKLFRRCVEVGLSFGVIEVLGPKPLKVQVATFRSDVSYSDGRRPDEVVFSTARADALRRDFTINGMFFDPIKAECSHHAPRDAGLIDYVGGQDDLKAGILRAIGNPLERFREDKLRLLRGVRLATTFDLTIEPATAGAIKAMAGDVTVVSAERIAEELRKLLVHPRRARGVNLLRELGLVEPILPELAPMIGLPQGLPDKPVGDLWDHVMAVLERLGAQPSFPLAFAALLHDVGKPRTVGRTPDRYTFYSHEHVGARMANDIALRLKFSNEERERIAWLVEKHIFLCEARQMRASKLKVLLAHPGIRELLALHRADALAWGKNADHVDYCEYLLREWTDADLNPPPLLTGHDLTRLGLEPGPIFKKLLDAVREAQLEGTIKDTQQALELVKRLLAEG